MGPCLPSGCDSQPATSFVRTLHVSSLSCCRVSSFLLEMVCTDTSKFCFLFAFQYFVPSEVTVPSLIWPLINPGTFSGGRTPLHGTSLSIALYTGVSQHYICRPVPAAGTVFFQISPQLAPLSPLHLCSKVTFQVRPSLTTLFKIVYSTLSVHHILLPFFLVSPPDTQYILLIYFLSPPIECTLCKSMLVLVLLMQGSA